MATVAEVLEFWFGQPPFAPRDKLWWQGGKAVDQAIAERFSSTVETALAGELEHWQSSSDSALALIICLDQFTRSIYRGSAAAFGGDPLAQQVCRLAIARGDVADLHYLQALFLGMPLEHAESLELQAQSVAHVRQLITRHEDDPSALDQLQGYLQHALEHQEIVQQYGRFPHRNEALGRSSTAAETAYLNSGAKRFGQ